MALTLIATVGSASANSYITRAEADLYFEASLHATVWDAAVAATKDKALVSATRILDQECEWIGEKATIEQSLRWPRSGTEYRDGDEIPDDIIPLEVKHATCELALSLLSVDRTADPETGGLTRLKVDVLEFVFDKLDRPDVLPLSVKSILGPYLASPSGDGGWSYLERA